MLSKLCAPYIMCPHSNNSHFSFKKVPVLTRSQIYTYILLLLLLGVTKSVTPYLNALFVNCP